MKKLLRSITLAFVLSLLPGLIPVAFAQTFNTPGTYTYNVAYGGVYTITAVGADGGDSYPNDPVNYLRGGTGATMKATFTLTAGSTLTIFVGNDGEDGQIDSRAAGGGGGGTAVILNGTHVLMAAAGGGGDSRSQGGFGALANTNSTPGAGGSTGYGAGGGGFNATAANPTVGCLSTEGGKQGTLTTIGASAAGFNPNCWSNGGDGGTGFGGGGGANGQSGGGGGGYKGGDGSANNGVGGNGGDSYVNTTVAGGTVVSATPGVDFGSITDRDGSVTIEAPPAPGGSLSMAQTAVSVFDHSSNNLADISLSITGSVILRGLQFTIDINTPNVQVSSITLGSAIATPSNWSFDYQITNAATGSSVEVVLYGKTNANVLAAGTYAQLFVVHYNVPDLALCDGALGGDITTGTITLGSVSSTANDGLGSGAGVTLGSPTETVTIYNTSSRGDVDCNDRVDVLDLSKTINVIAKRTTYSQWQKNRADMAPWSSIWATPGTFFSDANNYGDNAINIQDAVVMADAILNAAWPDGKGLYRIRRDDKSAGHLMNKASSIYDVKLTCFASTGGVQVWMENRAPVATMQLVLHVPDAPETIEAMLNAAYGDKFNARARRVGDEVRVLLYSMSGDVIAAQGGEKLLDLPMAGIDPSKVEVVEPVTMGDADGNPLLVVPEVVNGTSGVADDATTGGMLLAIGPNPAIDRMTIDYTLTATAPVRMLIIDASGREVARPLAGDVMQAGRHQLNVDVSTLASGSYMCSVTAGGRRIARSFIVVR